MMTNLLKVEELAKVARLNLADKAVTELAKELDEIAVWLNKLNELDTDNVEPLTDLGKELNN